MPRKAPTGVTEFRITLGDYERVRLDEFLTTLRIHSLTPLWDNPESLLRSPTYVISTLYSLVTILELVGIDTPIPTPVDAYEFLRDVELKKAARAATGSESNLEFIARAVFGLTSIPVAGSNLWNAWEYRKDMEI